MLLLLPMTDEELLQFFIGHLRTRSFVEQVLKVLLRIKTVCLCGFHHGEDRHAGIGAVLGIAEKPCFPPQNYGADAVLGRLFI